jgi:hypothetical protein
MTTNGHPIDPNDIAAVLDGTVTPTDRDRTLRDLARAGEAYEDFAEATAILREMEASALPTARLELISGTVGAAEKKATAGRWRFVAADGSEVQWRLRHLQLRGTR